MEKELEIGIQAACREARRWLGNTSPNPPVGAAALDASGKILAVAAHERAGQEHAEAKLLRLCIEQNLLADIHTLCVTLEPCTHHGKTPPCTDAILAAGIKHVVIGVRDPNPHVAGGGFEQLSLSGIDVRLAPASAECEQLIHAFAYKCQTGRPWVTVKRALTTVGTMIPPVGQKSFTGEASLKLAHRLRKKSDAILTGSGTILADNPLFTVRHVDEFKNRQRFLAILDRRRRVPETYLEEARQRGFKPIIYDDLLRAFTDLEARGATDILVESGPVLSQAVLDSHVWQMSITIQQTKVGDETDILFNAADTIPFDSRLTKLDWLLPL